MSGPYVQAALFCDMVLQEANGLVSPIRVLDRILIPILGEVDESTPPIPRFSKTLFVAFKAGEALGRYPLTIRQQLPSMQVGTEHTFDVHFDGAERGVNIILTTDIEAVEGLHWFDVILNGDQLLSRIPLRVIHQRMPTGHG